MEKELLSSFVTRSKNSSNRKSSAKAEDFLICKINFTNWLYQIG